MDPIDFTPSQVAFLPPHELVTYAKDQPEYRPLPVAKIHGEEGRVISRWALTDRERAMIGSGHDLYIEQFTFGGKLQPILPSIGLRDMKPGAPDGVMGVPPDADAFPGGIQNVKDVLAWARRGRDHYKLLAQSALADHSDEKAQQFDLEADNFGSVVLMLQAQSEGAARWKALAVEAANARLSRNVAVASWGAGTLETMKRIEGGPVRQSPQPTTTAPACVMGVYCQEHKYVHGAEAEELRQRFEQLIEAGTGNDLGPRDIQRILDDVDARDSVTAAGSTVFTPTTPTAPIQTPAFDAEFVDQTRSIFDAMDMLSPKEAFEGWLKNVYQPRVATPSAPRLWHPIETAPKDREIVLLGNLPSDRSPGMFEVRSCVSKWFSDEEKYPYFVGWLYQAPGYTDMFVPTHWSELPDAKAGPTILADLERRLRLWAVMNAGERMAGKRLTFLNPWTVLLWMGIKASPKEQDVLSVFSHESFDERLFTAIADVLSERGKQDAQWGGPVHDDTHTPYDWMEYIVHQIARWREGRDQRQPDSRERFTKIAALALAAIESIDRKAGKELR